jgi:hypothetical protein
MNGFKLVILRKLKMKKKFFILSIIVNAVFFYSCNEITVDNFVLTDENTPLHNVSYKYWYPKDSKSLKKEDIFVVKEAKKGAKKKLWMITPFESKTKKTETIYLRRRDMSKGNFVFQSTLWDTGKNISLFLGSIVNDSTIQFYGYNDAAMEYASKSNLLDGIKEHVLIKNDKISFDSIAATNHKEEILNFIKALNDTTYQEEDIVVLIGTNNIEKVKALLSK